MRTASSMACIRRGAFEMRRRQRASTSCSAPMHEASGPESSSIIDDCCSRNWSCSGSTSSSRIAVSSVSMASLRPTIHEHARSRQWAPALSVFGVSRFTSGSAARIIRPIDFRARSRVGSTGALAGLAVAGAPVAAAPSLALRAQCPSSPILCRDSQSARSAAIVNASPPSPRPPALSAASRTSCTNGAISGARSSHVPISERITSVFDGCSWAACAKSMHDAARSVYPPIAR
mmetsp:Transcript_31165/g.81479  ORF Transcript_31165/g.81479 Transcript_31165/m.81479 type:complete len:233 (-) Transcript_31165:72-770(-)